MPHDGTGINWDPLAPADTDGVPNGAQEIRDLRKGVELRLEREHEQFDNSSVGGEHLKGSAKAYFQGSAPTKRPDGVSDLGDADKGRIWCNNGIWYVYAGVISGWILQAIGGSNQIGASSIVTAGIQDGAVTTSKIADGGVTSAKIAGSGVTTAKLADGAVTGVKIAAGTITSDKLAVGAGGSTFALCNYETSPGVAGGAASAATWNTRALAEKADPAGFVTVSSSQVTLPAGTYMLDGWVQCYKVGRHLLRWRNITASSTPFFGTCGLASTTDTTPDKAFIKGIFTIGSTSVFELQHYTETHTDTNDLGKPANIGSTVEVYTELMIGKIG